MILACIQPNPPHSAWFTTRGASTESVGDAAFIQDPKKGDRAGADPLNEGAWDRGMRESLWDQLVSFTGADWSDEQRPRLWHFFFFFPRMYIFL